MFIDHGRRTFTSFMVAGALFGVSAFSLIGQVSVRASLVSLAGALGRREAFSRAADRGDAGGGAVVAVAMPEVRIIGTERAVRAKVIRPCVFVEADGLRNIYGISPEDFVALVGRKRVLTVKGVTTYCVSKPNWNWKLKSREVIRVDLARLPSSSELTL